MNTPSLRAKPQILLPVRNSFIIFTLLAAMTLSLFPWQHYGWPFAPDFMALAVLYWCTFQTRKFGVASAWLMGLVMDVGQSAVLGQHALGYAMLAFFGLILSRRVRRFNVWQQAAHVLVLLWLMQGLMAIPRLLLGHLMPSWTYYLASPLGALLWPVLVPLLQLPQRQPPEQKPS